MTIELPECESDCEYYLKSLKIKATASLGNDYEWGVDAFAWSADFDFKIEILDIDGNILYSYSVPFNIENNNPEEVFIEDITTFYNDAVSFRYSCLTNSATAFIADHGRVVFEYEADYLWKVNNSISYISLQNPTGSNPVNFSWISDCPFPNYEVQVLKLFDTDSLSGYDAEIDWNKALKIETYTRISSIDLTLTEGSGYYVWRVRPIGNYYPGGISDSRNFGEWTSHTGYTQGSTHNDITASLPLVFEYEQFNDTINWIYNRVFIEGAYEDSVPVRIGEGITYANGLAQITQKQGNQESFNSIMVSKTLYDYSGRSALQTMAVPVNQNYLEYDTAFFRVDTNILYKTEHFDSNGNYNDPLKADSISGNPFGYYSENNPDIQIPTSGGYPFTRTLFESGTGRVKEQGSVGAVHRISTDPDEDKRTVRTYYAVATDPELIHVFGDEAPGKATKIITVDPNNVTSVQYFDESDRLVATCLVKNENKNSALISLDSEADSFEVKYKIDDIFPTGLHTMSSVADIIMYDTTDVGIYYSILPETFENNCMGFCSTCDYKIQLKILQSDTITIFDSLYIINPGQCPENSNMILLTDTITLLPGTYQMIRDVQTMNIDTLSITTSTTPDTYLETFVDSITNYYNDTIDQQWAEIYNYINSGNIEGLYYDYFNLSPSLNPDEQYNGVLLGIPMGCDSAYIPVYLCPETPCFDSANFGTANYFSDYFDDYWSTHDSLVINGSGKVNAFGYHYTYTQVDELIYNMLNDVNSDYSCAGVWDCWQATVLNYEAFLTIEDPLYDFNLVNEFLDCTGRQFRGTCVDSFGNPGYYSHAYAYFYLDTLSSDSVCYYSMLNDTITGLDDFTDSLYNILYGCLGAYHPELYFDQDSLINANIQFCEERCNDRRAGFIESIIQEHHNDSLYIEGDAYELVSATLWGQSYVFDYDQSWSGTPYLTQQELMCFADALVDHCLEGCVLSPILNVEETDTLGWGTESELVAFQHSISSLYEIDLTQNGVCSEGFEPVYTLGVFTEPLEMNAVEFMWDTIFGGSLNDKLWSIVQTKDRGWLLGGYSSSRDTTVFGGNKKEDKINTSISDNDYWIIKLDSAKNYLWEQVIGGYDEDRLYTMLETKNGDILLGGSSKSDSLGAGTKKTHDNLGEEDFWFVCMDENGIIKWDTTYGGTDLDILVSIIEADTGYYLVGQSESDISSHKSQNCIGATRDYWVMKIDTSGNILWDKTLGTTTRDFLQSATTTYDNGVIMAGFTNGDTCSVGLKTEFSKGDNDFWIIKLNSSGDYVWDKTIGSSAYDAASAIIENDNREIVVLGMTGATLPSGDLTDNVYGDGDLWLVKLDQFGEIILNQTYGSEFTEGFFDNTMVMPDMTLIQTNAGNYLLGCTADDITSYTDTTDTRSDLRDNDGDKVFWMVYTDEDGNFIWDHCLSGNGTNYHTDGIQSFNRLFMLGGYSNGDKAFLHEKQDDAFFDSYDYWVLETGHECKADTICFKWIDFPSMDTIVGNLDTACQDMVMNFEPFSCDSVSAGILLLLLEDIRDEYVQHQVDSLTDEYITNCTLPESLKDTFELSYWLNYHHYTLYYYDRNGNLIKTVPPEGVNPLIDCTERNQETNHDMETLYEYNSLGQMIKQTSPDGGETYFFYNALGQLRYSENLQQRMDRLFTYSKYDALGRIVESGQFVGDVRNFQDSINSLTFPTYECNQRTYTVYTNEAEEAVFLDGREQRYLNNNVSYVYNDDGVYTYYSYDPHGNVEWLIQDVPRLGKNYISYDYDLLSGNVLKVKYNEGKLDQFFHKYVYNSDNKIKTVKTSYDGVIWDNDVDYDYYVHGPLKRSEIGDDKIQGIDYTYTIHGWLKAINHPALDTICDPGLDGKVLSDYATDAFGMQLSYYNGDFNRTGSPMNWSNSKTLDSYDNLYNGNIVSWGSQTTKTELAGYRYKYDDLQRIKNGNFYKYRSNDFISTNGWGTRYDYDANGNIQQLIRRGDPDAFMEMDSLTYEYENNTNKLFRVNDATEPSNYSTDIDGRIQYEYDLIGNLVKNSEEGIDTILWTISGKVAEVIRTVESTLPDLRFTYDANGNRVMKEVIFAESGPDTVNNETTFYILDPQGNIMAVYEEKYTLSGGNYTKDYSLVEHPIYGSDRIGLRNNEILVKQIDFITEDTTNYETNVSLLTENETLSLPMQYVVSAATPSLEVSALGFVYLFYTPLVFLNDKLGKVDIELDEDPIVINSVDAIYNNAIQGKNTFVAEDKFGNVMFTAITAKKYNSQDNVCILLDKNGEIIGNSTGILSSYSSQSIGMQDPESPGLWYLFTIGPDRVPYYHKINMAGEPQVTEKNVTLGNGPFGRTMTLVADYTTENRSRLFLRMFKNDSTYVVSYPVNESGIGDSLVVCKFASEDQKGNGEMQISSDGTKFAIADNSTSSAFSTADNKFLVYNINDSYNTFELDKTKIFDDYKVINSLDFSPQGTYVYYSEKSLTSTGSNKISRYNVSTESSSTVVSDKYGDVRRGFDANMQLCYPGEQSLISVTTPDAGSVSTESNTVSTGNWQLQGDLPLQAHRIFVEDNLFARYVGFKNYELNDHLGNVRVTFFDYKVPQDTTGNDPREFTTDLISQNNYYPFGMLQPGRNDQGEGYRFGFQGQEAENEIAGQTGSHSFFKYRISDNRIGRFFALDPLASKYPWNSPYAFSSNIVIHAKELEGLEAVVGVSMGGNVDYRKVILPLLNSEAITTSLYRPNKPDDPTEIEHLVDVLSTATSNDPTGTIGFLAIWGHGFSDLVYGSNEGITNNRLGSIDIKSLDGVKDAIENGVIKFHSNSVIFISACNAGTDYEQDGKLTSFAQELANITGVEVIAARNGQCGPLEESNNEMSFGTNGTGFFRFEKDKTPVNIGNEVKTTDLILKGSLMKMEPKEMKLLPSSTDSE
ncbi:MAG: hypothetical protein A2W91_12965 [Bacteroidetes bacterium GWF2_38_335]|nr:MAG: hypothetical protein A2W91_12965 [Bacteroidetes bacterium GWF2_38_335]HBS86935.1 hypothetical protein [Bacteroidales bacterium]